MTAARPWWRTVTREHWYVFIVATLAWLFDCSDQQVFNLARDGAMDALLPSKALSTEYAPYTTSVFLIGWAFGGLLFGAMGDRFGRARMLGLTVLMYSLCTGLNALSVGFTDFCVYRFLTGFGIGGVFGLSVALIADTVSDEARAPALGLLQSLSAWGNMLGGVVGLAVGLVHPLPFGLQPWQALFIVGAFPALLCATAMRKMKEPAKWVKAREAGEKRGIKFGSYKVLLKPGGRWAKNAWLGLIFCNVGIVGLWALGNFHPKLVGAVVEAHFRASGQPPDALPRLQAYWRSIGIFLHNTGGFIGMLALAKAAQVWGRRIAAGLAMVLCSVSAFTAFKYMRDYSDMYWMLPFMGFGTLCIFGVYAVYLPELFPTSLRSTGTSFCYNFGRLTAATAPFTMGRITRSLGGNIEGFRTAGIWISLSILIGLAVLPFMPETKGKPLPED